MLAPSKPLQASHLNVTNSWQGSHSSVTCLHCRSTLTPFLHNPYPRCRSPPPWPPRDGTTSSSSHPSPHFISPVVRGSSPPPSTNNNNPTAPTAFAILPSSFCCSLIKNCKKEVRYHNASMSARIILAQCYYIVF